MKPTPSNRHVPVLAAWCLAIIATLTGFFLVTTYRAQAAGNLVVTINAGYNLVVDSNVTATSTYAPSVATISGQFCNTGDDTLTNVVGHIGNYTGSNTGTPGIYPSRDSATDADFVGINADYDYLANTGEYAFTHVGGRMGTADATRYLGDLEPNQCKTQYWHFTYPRCANTGAGLPVEPPCTTSPTWGQTRLDNDDLSLDFDIWGTSAESIGGDATWTMTTRNEISAMANKIQPNPDGIWFNTNTATVKPGAVITSNGVFYELGNIRQGFDNDGDFKPDYNAWLQPVGDPSYDPSCFRLIRTTGIVTATRSGGAADAIIPFTDQLYFTDLPDDNTGVRGIVQYTFLALDGPCTTTLSPYQEVASGSNNEKFNGDFGIGIPPIVSTRPEIGINKTGDTIVNEGGTITYQIEVNNTGDEGAGSSLSLGVGGLPVVISDTIPAGLNYEGGSAGLTGDVGADILYYDTSSSTWVGSEPVPAANVGAIQWWLTDTLPATTGSVIATFQASVPAGYTSTNSGFIINDACVNFGAGIDIDCDDTVTLIVGDSTIGDYVWQDENSDGDPSGENGLDDITVSLYWDRNDDNMLDGDDILITTTATAGGGAYDFTQLPIGEYIVVVDGNDGDIPIGYNHTTPETIAVSIVADSTDYDDADFGFGPILNLTKSLTNGEFDGVDHDNIYQGQLATYQINVINNRPGGADNACEYVIWSGSAASSGNSNSQWQNIGLITGANDSSFANTIMSDNADVVDLGGYFITNQGGNITNVTYIAYVKELLEFNATDALDVEIGRGGGGDTSIYDSNALSDPFNGTNYFNSYTAGELSQVTIDLGTTLDWADFDSALAAGSQLSVRLIGNPGGGSSGEIAVDAAAFIITTDESCGSTSDTLNPVPVTDTYDPTKLEFVSANPPVSVQSSGVLTWSNVGPLEAGETQPLEVTFKVLSTGGEVITNTAATENAKYLDGRPANDAADDAPADTVGTVSIGDTVWFDADRNQAQNGGEPGLANVVLELRRIDGASGETTFYNGQYYLENELIITTTTDANGNYLFEGIPGRTSGSGQNRFDYSVTVLTSSPVLSGLSATVPGDDGDDVQHANDLTTSDDLTLDFGYNSANSMIYGNIWLDDSEDAIKDAEEVDIPNVTVELCTDAAGTSCSYQTTTDSNGNYTFTDIPNGTFFVVVSGPGPQVAEPDNPDSTTTCGTCNNASPAIVVDSSTSKVYGSYDFGYTGADIGDTVYVDWNGDGLIDSGEEGIPNIDVRLYSDINGNGQIDAEDSVISTTTTIADGTYLFNNYPAGNYIVIVDTGDSDFPNTYNPTGDPDSTLDSTHAFTTLPNVDKLDVDFGYQPTGVSSIGDYVWQDSDRDGVQDDGESGIDGITVTLYEDSDGNGVINISVDAVISVTETAAGGLYLFPDLPAGNYLVDVDTSDPQLPVDSDGNPYVLTTANDPDSAALGANEASLTSDFGFATGGVIGDYIWADNDADGVQDITEPPIAGVVVSLTLSSGMVVTTTTTADGLYEFTGLEAGIYTVTVSPITGYTQSGDPDVTQDCISTPSALCDRMSVVNLTAGQIDRSRDFGFQPDVVIGDYVWLDQNNDGVQDSNEPGLPNVVITLTLELSGVLTTTTDSDGLYTFGAVATGNHTIEVDTSTLPDSAVLVPTYDQDSGTGSPDSSSPVTVASNTQDLTYDFGYRYNGSNSLSGHVFYDRVRTDVAGQQDASTGDETYPDVTVYLWRQLSNGQYLPMGTTTTDQGGAYSFTGLPDGTYVASVDSTDPDLKGDTYTTGSDVYVTNADNTAAAYETATISGSDVTDVDFGFYDLDSATPPTAVTMNQFASSGSTHNTGLWLALTLVLLGASFIIVRHTRRTTQSQP